MNAISVLRENLESLIEDFIIKYDELGLRATGEWAKSLELNPTGTGFEILGAEYTENLTNGTPPGENVEFDRLKEWVKIRFNTTDEGALNGITANIARNIFEEGTTHYQNGGTDLIDGVLTQQREDEIMDDVGQSILTQIEEDILRAIFV